MNVCSVCVWWYSSVGVCICDVCGSVCICQCVVVYVYVDVWYLCECMFIVCGGIHL